MTDFTPDQMRLVTDELDRARQKGKVFGIETERDRIEAEATTADVYVAGVPVIAMEDLIEILRGDD
jgi:hypothetical protein